MDPKIRAGLDKTGIAHATRHLFLCIGPDCCQPADGERTWEYVKQRVKETGLPLMRSKAACLRICHGGPWLVVYPEGIWYGGITPEPLQKYILAKGETAPNASARQEYLENLFNSYC